MWEPAQLGAHSKRKIKMARAALIGERWVPKLNREPNGQKRQYDRSGQPRSSSCCHARVEPTLKRSAYTNLAPEYQNYRAAILRGAIAVGDVIVSQYGGIGHSKCYLHFRFEA